MCHGRAILLLGYSGTLSDRSSTLTTPSRHETSPALTLRSELPDLGGAYLKEGGIYHLHVYAHCEQVLVYLVATPWVYEDIPVVQEFIDLPPLVQGGGCVSTHYQAEGRTWELFAQLA